MKKIVHIIIALLLIVMVISCEDEKYVSSNEVQLSFSADTVMFDTIFTAFGSTTQHLKVYNPYEQKVLISSVRLAKGDASNFRLNVNGIAANEVFDLEIPPKDSIYIFVEVTVDPTGNNMAMVVQDSIEFSTNASFQDVDLVAWGQDFHLIKEARLKTTTWTADKPYLVYNYAYVDSGEVLTIEPGARIYFHSKAGMYVRGRIKAMGEFGQPIVFQGDRLEDVYEDVPDQWNGLLLFSGSHNNIFNYAEIKNANIGLQVGNIEDEGHATVELSNTKIYNHAYAGIFSLKSKIKAYNCLIANCGFYAAALLVGGDYDFYHTTIANYWGGFSSSSRSTASLVLSNLLIIDQASGGSVSYVGDMENANFSNSIITGNIRTKNELELGISEEAVFNYSFNHCLMQLSDTFDISDPDYYTGIIRSADPQFKDPFEKMNFELDTLSPAKDAGLKMIGQQFPFDLLNQSRIGDSGPDLGAYERIEKALK
ncbi:hypothetical protein [uncultured Sunxiuqinia sp.]|uniref:hypothetical protein n=1 Tax=uncultured Sunxiuqinia sp. TaxID=1573825 RepID=UPI0030DB4632